MNEAIKQLRKFFDSDLWIKASQEDQPIVSDQGLVTQSNSDMTIFVRMNTKINLALDFEGKFNDMAATYMKWRKEMKLPLDKE